MTFEKHCAERFGGTAVLWGQVVNGPIRLVPSMRCCFIGDRQIKLSPKETCLLEQVMKRPGEAISCEEIWQNCWGNSEVNLTAIRLHFSHIRDRFKSAGIQGNLIMAFNRKGYGIQDCRHGIKSEDLFVSEITR